MDDLINDVLGAGTDCPGDNGNLATLTGHRELDREIYCLLALILREFVLPWYDGVSSERAFIHNITQCFHASFIRFMPKLRRLDSNQFLLEILPAILSFYIHGRANLYVCTNRQKCGYQWRCKRQSSDSTSQ